MIQDKYEKIKTYVDDFIAIRRQIHQHPEVGFCEQNTSNIVTEILLNLGYKVETGFAKTGVVATLKRGSGNKVLGLRADLDALPMQENSGKEWASKYQGCFHGCGHDGHTASLLCAAKYLAESADFDGTVHLIFQPAEELLYGGRVMLEDGLFEKYPCDDIFALHKMPGLKEGSFHFKKGAFMASADTLEINVLGKGGHGGLPETTTDSTLIACYIATALQSIVSRNVSPKDAAVITIGSIQAGDAANIINAKAKMLLSVRTLNPETREMVLKRVQSVAECQAEGFGAKIEFKHLNGCPVLVNGEEATEFAIQVAREILPAEFINTNAEVMMGSEDFAFMLEANPSGSYFFVGAGDGENACMVHNPSYDFNDNLIYPAARYWCALVERYLG